MILKSVVKFNAKRAISIASRGKHTLPDLPYDYNALEPFISAEIMKLHHSKHHQTYVNNLNATLEKLNTSQSVSTQIQLQGALKFNGGGHINHSIFWQNMAPPKGSNGQVGGDLSKASGELVNAIKTSFGGWENFQRDFAASATAVQGSGWAWLAFEAPGKPLRIVTTLNQDPCHATTGLVPLLGCDVWEHAYYLQYKNVRPDYLKAFWSVVNWKDVSERLSGSSK